MKFNISSTLLLSLSLSFISTLVLASPVEKVGLGSLQVRGIKDIEGRHVGKIPALKHKLVWKGKGKDEEKGNEKKEEDKKEEDKKEEDKKEEDKKEEDKKEEDKKEEDKKEEDKKEEDKKEGKDDGKAKLGPFKVKEIAKGKDDDC